MKVALVTGLCPPGRCGVGDYTVCLSNALAAGGVENRVIASPDWSPLAAFKVRDTLKDFDLVHIQYPTLGFGHQLGPQVLALLRNCVITVHEASQRRIWRKLSLLPFMARPQHLIFTSDFERRFVTGLIPWVARNSSVIPVASNIKAYPGTVPRASDEVVFFGLITPHRGCEDVLELGRLIKLRGLPLRVRIVGSCPPEHAEYLAALRSGAAEVPVIWDFDLSEEQVAERLASSAVAYLPFPDGASERRTSLKAALVNGVAVVTTLGPHTPNNLKPCLRFSNNPQEALSAVCSLLQSWAERAELTAHGSQFMGQCTWGKVADLHSEVYRSVLDPGRSSAALKAESV